MWRKLQMYTLGIAALLLGLAVAMVFASVTTALLILRDTSAPVSAMAPAAAPPIERADQRVPSAPATAEQPPAQGAEQMTPPEMPRPETSPASLAGAPRDPEHPLPSDEQGIFKARRALETVDARELLRQARMPK